MLTIHTRSLWYKMSWYENSARVPMIFHYPRLFKPHRVDESVSTLDLLPTLVDITGAKLDNRLSIDGRSFYKALLGQGKVHDEVYGEYMGEGTCTPLIMIRRGKYKYITCLADPPMLFNLQDDALEANDLCKSKDPGHTNVAAAFAEETAKKWDLRRIHEEVLASQRKRRLCWGALKSGRFESWDYDPPSESHTKYIRSTIELDELERKARYPPVDHLGRESFFASTHGLAGAAGE